MQKVLLIEDEVGLHEVVRSALSDTMNVICVSTIDQARSELTLSRFDLILLDIGLPDGDGFEFCTLLKSVEKWSQIPIIFISAHSDGPDQMKGFSLGAADFIAKPFHILELRARTQMRIRACAKESSPRKEFQFGSLQFDIAKGKVLVGSQQLDVQLTPTEFRLMFHMAMNPDRVISPKELLEVIAGAGFHLSKGNLYTRISSIRKKLGEAGKCIESVPGAGYICKATDKENMNSIGFLP